MGADAGEELLRRGDLGAARAAFAEEAAVAEAAGDAPAFARAALGRSGLWVHDYRSQLDRAEVAACQERALAGLAAADPLARRLRLRWEAERRYGGGDDAAIDALLVEARAADEPTLLADALHLAGQCLLGPQHASRRLDLAEELIALSPITGRPNDGLLGLAHRALCLLELGDGRSGRAIAELRAGLAADDHAALRYVLDTVEVLRAVGSGRLGEAESLAHAAHERGVAVGDADADTWHAAQLLAIRWFEGRGAEMLAICEAFIDAVDVAEPAAAAFVAAGGVAAVECDRDDVARACLARLRAGPGALPVSTSWLAAQFGIGEMVVALGDTDAAIELIRTLTPYAGRPAIVSRGVVTFGSTHRPLGLAAATIGRWEDAVAHLSQALRDDLATGTVVAIPHTQWSLADAMEGRGAPGDVEEAARLRRLAVEQAEAWGLTGRAVAWRERLAPRAVTLRRRGRTWDLSLGARHAELPTTVGMGYLAELVANPGVEIPAAELVSRYAVGQARAENVLDDQAIRAYRARISQLRGAIEDADATGDVVAGTRAETELDAIMGELARATGLRGEPRAFADANERARVAVHRAIHRALAAIDRADPEIGGVLRRRVSTGVRCLYDPE